MELTDELKATYSETAHALKGSSLAMGARGTTGGAGLGSAEDIAASHHYGCLDAHVQDVLDLI